MGIAEIQAALAQGAPTAPSNPFGAPAPARPAPFAAPPTAAPNPFGGSAPQPFAVTLAPAPAFGPPARPDPFAPPPAPVQTPAAPPAPTQATSQTAFAFTPPAGFNPASAPPINPPGERASLNTPAPTEAVQTSPFPGVAQASAAPVEAPPAEPKRRGRRPGAKNAGGMPGVVAEAPLVQQALQAVADCEAVPLHRRADAEQALASPAEVVLGSISTEDLVAVLRERGYSVWLEAKG